MLSANPSIIPASHVIGVIVILEKMLDINQVIVTVGKKNSIFLAFTAPYLVCYRGKVYAYQILVTTMVRGLSWRLGSCFLILCFLIATVTLLGRKEFCWSVFPCTVIH